MHSIISKLTGRGVGVFAAAGRNASSNILREFSSTQSHPYATDEGDERSLKYQVLFYRAIRSKNADDIFYSGPATAIFPGVPGGIISDSCGILSLESLNEGMRIYPIDGNTDLALRGLDCKYSPLITVPALFKLSMKFSELPKEQKEISQGDYSIHNEGWTNARKDNTAPCIGGAGYVEREIKKFSDWTKKANLNFSLFYDCSVGQVFWFKSEEIVEFSKEFGSSNLQYVINKFKEDGHFFDAPLELPRNVFTLENYQHDQEMSKFVDQSYEAALKEIAYRMLYAKSEKGDYLDLNFKPTRDSKVLKFLIGEAEETIAKTGAQQIKEEIESRLQEKPNPLFTQTVGLNAENIVQKYQRTKPQEFHSNS